MPKYIEDAHSQEKREIKNKDPVAVKQLETTALKPPPNTTPRLHKRLAKSKASKKKIMQKHCHGLIEDLGFSHWRKFDFIEECHQQGYHTTNEGETLGFHPEKL
jgi:hypothetical protein